MKLRCICSSYKYATIAIYPTVSENFTTLDKTKSSGEDPQNSGC